MQYASIFSRAHVMDWSIRHSEYGKVQLQNRSILSIQTTDVFVPQMDDTGAWQWGIKEVLAGSDFEQALQCSIFEELQTCVQASGEPCEGSIMHTWNSFAPVPEMKSKQRNLFHLAQQAGEGAKILEVGFNAGHSVCLMMLANPTSKVITFDLCEHHYTKPCVEALKRFFGPHRLELVEGSSADTLPRFHRQQPDVQFDLFHVDGGHQYQQALADLKNCS
eukprot:s1270_g15.t1